jgi:hypothetical protein
LNLLKSHDNSFLIVSTEFRGTRIQCFSDGKPVADYLITGQSLEERAEMMRNGVFVSDQSVYEHMKPYIPVVLTGDESSSMTFDGTHRRRYLLRLAPYGA